MISVILPTYNNENTIERAIFSVVYQTIFDWELVIVDDASTDCTPDVIRKYVDGDKIRVIQNAENKGAGISRQVGLADARGEFVTFLDSDDLLKPDYLEACVTLQKQHDSDVVYTSYTILYPQGAAQNIPAGDYIMQGEATAQMHFAQEKKFLTGKLFRKSLLESIPWSDKRIGEDVQTLFFATYQADRVRSSSYSGYVHCFREGSLLADAPYFLCYCGSTMAQQEIIDYLEGKGDTRLYEHCLEEARIGFIQINEAIKQGVVKRADVLSQKKEWKQVRDWFRKHGIKAN